MFTATIARSSRELSKRERVILTDTSDATRLDEATADGPVVIDVDLWVELDIDTGTKQYKNYLVQDKNGTKYVTGSENFWNAFQAIAREMEGEEYSVKAYGRPSRNYAGKSFLTCSLV